MATIHLSARLVPFWVIAVLLAVSLASTAPVFAQFTEVQPVALAPSTGYGKLPLSFEANQGQSDRPVKFFARGQGYGLFLTPTETVLSLRPQPDAPTNRTSVVRMRLVGANRRPQLTGLDLQTGKSNYLIGNDPARWRRDVPNYAGVKSAQVYPGIDLIYHGNQRQLEYDFVVAPGADPGRIQIAFKGVEKLSLDSEGNLVLATGHGNIVQHKPVVYQDLNGERRSIDGRYVLRGKRRASFDVGSYDTAHPLVIDPVMVYATYLGGASTDLGTGIAVDSAHNVYVTGWTSSSNFPTAGSFQAALSGPFDAFVTKLNPTGTALIYSTYLGGTGQDLAAAIAVDGNGSAYITGRTDSTDFPIAPQFGAILATAQGGLDAFVTKLDPSGSSLVYSTYLSGNPNSNDVGTGIAVDGSGNAYVVGTTDSANFIGTPGAFQVNYGGGISDAWVVGGINPGGTGYLYITLLGGSGDDHGTGIAVDASGNAYLTGYTNSTNFPLTSGNKPQPLSGGGYDAFFVKFNAAGSALLHSTFLGGSGDDRGLAIALNASGNACIAGSTSSTNFPTLGGIQVSNGGGASDAFVTKYTPAFGWVYSTYLGGSGLEQATGIAEDSSGNAYVTGITQSQNFPFVSPVQGPGGGAFDDAFVAKVNPTGTVLLYATYLGGNATDQGTAIAVDSRGNALVTGKSASTDFFTVGAYQVAMAGVYDAFVAKISTLTATSTGLVSSLNPSIERQAVTFTATVSGTTPTGTVQFKDGVNNLGTPVTLSGGVATYTTSTLTVGTHSITAFYDGDASFDFSASPALSQVVNLPPFGAPAGLVARINTQGSPAILTWYAVSGVDHYEVARSSNNSAYATIGSAFGSSQYLDFSPFTADTTYLYKVRAVASGGAMSGYSNVDPATTVFFTDDPLIAGSTIVKAAQVNQLRTAANAMRAAAGMTAATFTDPTLSTSTIIRAVHMQQIRTALDEARATLLLPTLVYTEGTLTPTVSVIKAAFVQQMRDGTK